VYVSLSSDRRSLGGGGPKRGGRGGGGPTGHLLSPTFLLLPRVVGAPERKGRIKEKKRGRGLDPGFPSFSFFSSLQKKLEKEGEERDRAESPTSVSARTKRRAGEKERGPVAAGVSTFCSSWGARGKKNFKEEGGKRGGRSRSSCRKGEEG